MQNTMTPTEEKLSVDHIVDTLKSQFKTCPKAAVVLGSGVKVLEELTGEKTIKYSELFGISPSIAGHSGTLTVGKLGRKTVCVMRGRFHLYEGYDWATVTLPARVMAAWGVPNLFLTNAAGGLNKSFRVGDLMLLTAFRDQLSPILKETGLIPALIDPPTSTQNELSDLIVKVNAALAKKSKTYRSIQEGTYAGLLGPSYETHAEIEMLRRLGSDAVGMSTVPELKAVIGTATQAAAISVITNVWSEDVALEGHKEVLKAAKEASKRLDTLLTEVIAKA